MSLIILPSKLHHSNSLKDLQKSIKGRLLINYKNINNCILSVNNENDYDYIGVISEKTKENNISQIRKNA